MLIPGWVFDLTTEIQFYRINGSTLADVVNPGQRPATRPGRGTEWFGKREYVPGDPLNIIDWCSIAHHSYLENPPIFVKTFDAELANVTTVVVDCSSSMDVWPMEGKLSTAIGVSVLLAWAAVNHGDPVEILFVGDTINRTGLINNPVEFIRGINTIEAIPFSASGEMSWNTLMDSHHGLDGSRHTIVLIGDFFESEDEIAKSVSGLGELVRTVLAIRIISPSDEDPFKSGQDLELYDVENANRRKSVNVDLEKYRQRFEYHQTAVADVLMEEGVRFADIKSIPLNYSRGRSKGVPFPHDIINKLIEAELIV